MKTNRIEVTNFNAQISINANQNKRTKYLYNTVLKMTNAYKIPATFETDTIFLPRTTEEILQKLNKLNIKYTKTEPKTKK